jgi:hypothetical protein
MTSKKNKPTVKREKPINDKEYNDFVSKALKSLKNPEHKSKFEDISKKGWFKSYANKSQSQLRKITAKVKKGLRHGQYTYGVQPHEVKGKRYVPKRKNKAYKAQENKIIQRIKSSKSPKVKTRLTKGHKKYPDASEYELRYGVNSQKSQKYREKRFGYKEYKGTIIKRQK